MYEGEYGWAYQVSMRILARLGDLFNADRLIPIQSSHLSGISYKTLGDAPIDFLQALVDADGKVAVQTTTNPSGVDSQYFASKLPIERVGKQTQILSLYEKMGVNNILTCTPYYITEPKEGSHLAWAESSAVIYANSILQAWTNREGGPSALAAALIGKTPNYGVHRLENREPSVKVKLERRLETEAEFGALGIFLGKQIKDKAPVFEDLSYATKEDLKQLGAAMASSGMTNLFYAKPPSWLKQKSGMETIFVEARDIEATMENMNTTDRKSSNLIFIGCPHCSVNELAKVAKALKHKKVAREKELWICTSRHLKENSKSLVKAIENAGAKVICNTCAVVTWLKDLSIDSLMTNSAKTAYYAPTLNNIGAVLAPLNHCIEAATSL